ncbi:MAG: hypothetical protein HKN47_16315, partial [Pirellulaceae bacterium]|nr:hypothetical protein [Pirellulaceae bacterium]
IHRNTANLAVPLTLQLTTDSEPGSPDLLLDDHATIPVGMRSVVVPIGVIDNFANDGDRTVTIRGTANAFNVATATIEIIDDEMIGIVVDQSDGVTEVTETQGDDQISIRLGSQPSGDVAVDVNFDNDQLVVSATRLMFTPESWNVAQTLDVHGLADWLVEGDVTSTIQLNIDTATSDPDFTSASDTTVDVMIHDYQIESFRVADDESKVYLIEEGAGVAFDAFATTDGIDVRTNQLSQTVTIDPLLHTTGPVLVDLSDGDDRAVLRGDRFTLIRGGAGHDQLVIDLEGSTVDLVALLDGRVSGFEEVTLPISRETEVMIDGQSLSLIVGSDGTIVIRLSKNQSLNFSGDAVSESPVMVGVEFAQVIRSGQSALHVISESPWQNELMPGDINRSGDVTPADIIAVINKATFGTGPLSPPTSLDEFENAFYDASGDGLLTPLDILTVINILSDLAFVPPEDVPQGEMIAGTVGPLGPHIDGRSNETMFVSAHRYMGQSQLPATEVVPVGWPAAIDRVMDQWSDESSGVEPATATVGTLGTLSDAFLVLSDTLAENIS